MGLLGRFLGRAVKKIGNAMGKAVEKIGEAVHSNAIEMAGFHLRCACDFGHTGWSARSTTVQTVDVHKELNKIISSIAPDAAKKEETLIQICIKEVGEVLDGFLGIAPVPELLRLKENYEAETRAALSGQFMRYAQPRLSLDNSECKQILGIQDDSKRKKQAAKFKEEVLEAAAKQFTQQCLDVKRDYCEHMLELSKNSLLEAKREHAAQKKLLDRLLQENKDEAAIDLERAHVLLLQEKLALLAALAFEPNSINK